MEPMGKITLHQVEDKNQREAAGLLIREYLTWLNGLVKTRYGHDFDTEAMLESDLKDPDKFFPPQGRLYLALSGGETAGVGCLKKLKEGVGEIQRMYVAPSFRSLGLGRAIVECLIAEARQAGYCTLRLESMDFLHQAHSLYESVGFHRIEPYADNSMSHYQPAESLKRYYTVSVYMEMELGDGVPGGAVSAESGKGK